MFLATGFHFKKSEAFTSDVPQIVSAEMILNKMPLFTQRNNTPQAEIKLEVSAGDAPLLLTQLEIHLTETSRTNDLAELEAFIYTPNPSTKQNALFGKQIATAEKLTIVGQRALTQGSHSIMINFHVEEFASLLSTFEIERINVSFSNHESIMVEAPSSFVFRPATLLRASGQDNTDTYRIPGIITTNTGTLVAVYDNRYNNSKDLQEDIDIGMSRSTNGGVTWEPMKVIMDMGEWGGRSERLNGIGDPAILYDPNNHTIWVAALWMSGSAPDQMLWWASQPGMEPHETGQFILSKSTDDGLTWSEPINITRQIKDPKWSLLLQGPGAGITMRDGTLVFPAQFKEDIGKKALDGGQFTAHATIIYSKDAGNNWHIGTGARPNTTEAQVVELADGTLMLNMRDDRNRTDKGDSNGRAVSVTTDLGKTWTIHPSSNGALQEPNCMASLISTNVPTGNTSHQVLFFSNPNSRETRTNMTIKTSLDGGLTWPELLQTELYPPAGYGYSCMTMVDEQTIGIVYEGTKDLIFQKVLVNDLLRRHNP